MKHCSSTSYPSGASSTNTTIYDTIIFPSGNLITAPAFFNTCQLLHFLLCQLYHTNAHHIIWSRSPSNFNMIWIRTPPLCRAHLHADTSRSLWRWYELPLITIQSSLLSALPTHLFRTPLLVPFNKSTNPALKTAMVAFGVPNYSEFLACQQYRVRVEQSLLRKSHFASPNSHPHIISPWYIAAARY